MELLHLLFLIGVSVICFQLGQKWGSYQANQVKGEYIQLRATETHNSSDQQLEKQQKEFDRLQKELQELTQKEKKQVTEIKQLRARLDEPSSTPTYQSQTPKTPPNVDLITDTAFDSLLDEASKDAKQTQEFNEDDFDQELTAALS